MTDLELEALEEEKEEELRLDEYIENQIDEMRDQRLMDEDYLRRQKDV